jgi:16S rRNA (cytidine1402-2'-O)-methyltransferase
MDPGLDGAQTPHPDPGAGAPGQGLLLLAGAPIGDPQDASPRLARALQEADLVAAEDTRRLARLTSALGLRISGRVVSYHEHNEARRTPELLAALLDGRTVVVITDAGMPSVSDPGYRLVAAAAAAGVRVSAAPGPSAVLTALAVSGLPVDRFCFEGFLPRKPGERGRALAGLTDEPRTLVFFEAPHRLAAALAALAAAFGADRPAAVCRELTKTYEEVVRGGLGELAGWAGTGQVRGEITVVVQGAPPPSAVDPADLVGRVQALCDDGSGLKQAVAAVAEQHGVAKRDLYAAALAAR